MTRTEGRRLLVVSGFLFAVILAELGLRFVGGVFHDDFSIADSARGWALRPGFSGWTADENTLYEHINSDGLRDREHSLVKPAHTLRVAVLGDSYMQAQNVPLEKTFSAFLESRVSQCLTGSSRQAEVINFGVSGYGTAQELLTFRHQARKYDPDVVLLAFYTNNDVYNNSRLLNPSSSSEKSPYFVFDGDRLVLDDAFRTVLEAEARPSPLRRVRMMVTEHLRTAQLLNETQAGLRDWWSARDLPANAETAGTGPPENLENLIYLPPARPETKEAWRVTEALLLMLDQEVRAQGAEFWIVTLSNLPQVDPDLTTRKKFAEALGVDSLFYPDLRIRTFALKHAVPVITLAPALADYAAERHAYLNGGYNARYPAGKGHWNETANRAAAEMVGSQLCSASAPLR